MHFTPAGSSWMNLVERFFADLTGDCIREGSFRSVRELIEAFEKYLADRNANPKRYVWRAKGEEILRKIERAKEALAGRLEPDNSKYMTLAKTNRYRPIRRLTSHRVIQFPSRKFRSDRSSCITSSP